MSEDSNFDITKSFVDEDSMIYSYKKQRQKIKVSPILWIKEGISIFNKLKFIKE